MTAFRRRTPLASADRSRLQPPITEGVLLTHDIGINKMEAVNQWINDNKAVVPFSISG